eukprot:4526424-Pleurochrysis_carterae.AAC.1
MPTDSCALMCRTSASHIIFGSLAGGRTKATCTQMVVSTPGTDSAFRLRNSWPRSKCVSAYIAIP